MSLWDLCKGHEQIKPISADPWRIVEAQHVLSARDLVDSTDEHDVLENMLEDSKPSINKEKDYLIFTPFRYPPLKYGSRFGSMFEPSLWYGSLAIETAFAEVAWYQHRFHMDTTASLGYIETLLTAFNTSLSTDKGIDLTSPPFASHKEKISAKDDYQHSQNLGTAMRDAGISAFLYNSARSHQPAQNIAAFVPDVFYKKNNQYIRNQQTWNCLSNRHIVEFTRIGISGKKRYCFEYSEAESESIT